MNAMIKHHPDDNLLTEYSAGALAKGPAIALSAHLHFCARCRQRVDRLNALGANLMTEAEPVPVSNQLLEAVWQKLDSAGVDDSVSHREQPGGDHKPKILQKILRNQGPPKWQFLTPSLDVARLKTGQRQFEVALHRIRAGGSVAAHDHRGTEITLVLEGSFSDEGGSYQVGDFLVREPGQAHRPLASRDAPCICLSVVAAPVRMTGPIARLLNPFLSINPQ